ncbi:MAG: M23 family metallopeptidase [Treponemataceae bacterium]
MYRTRLISAIVAALISAPILCGIDWPTTKNELHYSFGQNDHGRPSVGMLFSGNDSVRATDAGEIVFAASGGYFATQTDRFPYTLGSWIAVDHGNGIVSAYGNLEPFDATIESKTIVEKGSVLGTSGISGWAENQGFFFSIFDRIERRWVNPTMLSPGRADSRPPTVKSVTLIGRDGQNIPLAANRLIRQGSYRVIVEAFDTENAPRQYALTPQRLVCLVNGSEQGALHLETLKTINGELSVSRIKSSPANLVYLNSGAFDLGDIRLSRGRTTIELIARDSGGNERVASFSIAVE